MYAQYVMHSVLVCPGRAMKLSIVMQSFLDSRDQFGIDFLPCIGVKKCLGAELGHIDIPMPEYYRSDENAWPLSFSVFYTRFFFLEFIISRLLSSFSNEFPHIPYLI